MQSDTSAGLVRMLIYPVIFAGDPVVEIDRVIGLLVDTPAALRSRADFIAAITAALESSDKLSELIPQPHSEAVIRSYLSALRDQLKGGSG